MYLKSSMLPAGLAWLLWMVAARAELVLVVAPGSQSGVGRTEVCFTGTLTNSSLTDNLLLNNVQVAFTGAATNYLSADTNVFFANVPGLLLPGETYNDILFGIVIAPATPPGQYCGSVSMQGGTDIFAGTNLAGQTFQVSLPPAALAVSVSSTNFLLSWLSPPGGFVLQVNSDLTTTNWLAATNPAATVNGTNQLLLTPAGGNLYYRLEYP